MGKRTQRRLSRRERDQAGCMRGLINIFDFRHSRTTKRLLTDGSKVGKNALGAEHSNTRTVRPDATATPQNIDDDDEVNMPLVDCGKTSVKELMEEEMSNEQGPTTQSDDVEIESEQVDKKVGHHTKKNSKRKNRICNKSSDMDAVEMESLKCEFLRVLEKNNLDKLDLKIIVEELACNYLRSTNLQKHDQDDIAVHEKMVAAVKLLIENGVNNSKHFGDQEKSQYSKELVDALQTLSSDKALLLKMLHDPSPVLVKPVKDLKDSEIKEELAPSTTPESGLLEKKQKPGEVSGRKHHSLFRRRSKSLESLPIGRDADSNTSNKIVILKPGPGGGQSPDIDVAVGRRSLRSEFVNNMTSNPKNASQFSFTEIKRKLRHAMGKERNGVSHEGLIIASPRNQNGDKTTTGETLGWSSPNRNHFYTERFSKSLASSKNGSAAVNGNSRPGVSNIYIEAKKHLSEILNNGEATEPVSGKVPKPLGRILSYPDYSSPPCFSPREHGEDTFITAQMRLSPRGMIRNNIPGLSHDNHNNLTTPSRRSLESQPRISNGEVQSPAGTVGTLLANDQGPSVTESSITSEGKNLVPKVVEIEEAKFEEEEEKSIHEKLESRLEEEETSICSTSIGIDTPTAEIREVVMEEVANQCSEDVFRSTTADLQEEHNSWTETISPSCSPASEDVKENNCAIDHVERPSPVSVLDLLYTEEDISPASTISRPAAKEIQPRHIHFEDQYLTDEDGTCVRISLEDEESAFEYVEAVLLGSGLNWDEFLLRWLSFEELLDSSLFDEVELFSSRSRHDQKFLFDCANNALNEVCQIHFGCFTGTSRIISIWPVPKGMDLINEVWNRVEWLLLQLPQRHSLDQLVKKDLAESVKWMNIQSEVELIGSEMGDTIFEELIEDTMTSFFNDTSTCELTMRPSECYSNEDACQLVDSDRSV